MSDAGADGGAAKFAFNNNGLIVEVDSQDNPNGHVNMFTDAGTQVSFAIANTGEAAGTADVNVSVDGSQVQTWTSPQLAPGASAGPDGDGFVHGCGRYQAGSHTFSATVGPTGGGNSDDTATNTVNIEDPPSSTPNPSSNPATPSPSGNANDADNANDAAAANDGSPTPGNSPTPSPSGNPNDSSNDNDSNDSNNAGAGHQASPAPN